VASVRTGTVYNIETDNLNTPVRVLDQNNNIDWSWEGKEPFGLSQPVQAIVNGSNFIFNLRFIGQYVDQETGLFQNGYREYDPTTGRYMEVDPLGLSAGWNPYNYTTNNPLNYTDYSGLDIWIEGPSGNEPSGHQSINVGNPNGHYLSVSFGLDPQYSDFLNLRLSSFPFFVALPIGNVYLDTQHGGKIERYKKTSKKQDFEFAEHLYHELGKIGIYGVTDICRSFSQREFNLAPGIETFNFDQRYINVNNNPLNPFYKASSQSNSWTSK
jgi:RHS repeat-associated protein